MIETGLLQAIRVKKKVIRVKKKVDLHLPYVFYLMGIMAKYLDCFLLVMRPMRLCFLYCLTPNLYFEGKNNNELNN